MSNRRLLLVSANRFTVPYPVYPLGISYLKAYLNETMPSLKIDVFDFMTGSFEDYIKLLHEIKPDFTGISLRNIDDVNIYRQESFISHYRQIIKSNPVRGGAHRYQRRVRATDCDEAGNKLLALVIRMNADRQRWTSGAVDQRSKPGKHLTQLFEFDSCLQRCLDKDCVQGSYSQGIMCRDR